MNAVILTAIRTTLKAVGLMSPSTTGKIAFYLFCHPSSRAEPRKFEVKWIDRAEKNKLSVNGKTLTTYAWGDGTRPVLLLHGWESRGSRFAGIVAKLKDKGYTPVTFDAPAHGESSGSTTTILEYADISKQLAERYGRFSAIVGHSFGVLSVFQALRSGIETDRVVSISGVCDFRYLLDKFSHQLGLSGHIYDDLKIRIERLFAPFDNIWNQFSVTYQANRIKLPILVVQDEHDELVDLQQAKKISDAYRNHATLITTRNLGHHRILMDKSVIQAVIRFITDGPVVLDKGQDYQQDTRLTRRQCG